MAKIALLIGVSEYGSGLNPLPGAVRNVEAVQQVLQSFETDRFDEVKLLPNPNPPVMRAAIENLFSGRSKNDLALLFFSGHIVRDNSHQLYFATAITCKNPKGKLIGVSAIPANFVHDLMSNSPCQRQLVILDGCLERASTPQRMVSDEDDIKIQLGGKGRAILTSFASSQTSMESKGSQRSVFTRYLVEGIKTGAADLDSDGWIAVDELYEYASNKVRVAAPVLNPKFYPVEDGDKMLLFNAPNNDPKLNYRKEAENWVSRGGISQTGRHTLDELAKSLQLASEDCTVIEDEILKPYQEYQKKLQHYQRELAKIASKDYPLATQEREKLRSLQQSLELRDEDIAPIEEQMALKLTNLPQSKDNANELAQPDNESEPKLLPSTPSAVLPESTQTPTVQQTNPTTASETHANELPGADSQRELKPISLTPSAILPEYITIPDIQLTNPTPAVDPSSSSADSQTSPPSAPTFPKKLFLTIGIGGGLAALAVAIGTSTHMLVAPPADRVDRMSPSPDSSQKLSATAKNSNQNPSPSPSSTTLLESKDCSVFINGNLRSEPTSFQSNVVESLKEPLLVTGKQTVKGWVEVRLSDNRTAWAHPDIMDNKLEMDACMAKKGITITKIEDILPPASSSYP
jgi:hypothetical protein